MKLVVLFMMIGHLLEGGKASLSVEGVVVASYRVALSTGDVRQGKSEDIRFSLTVQSAQGTDVKLRAAKANSESLTFAVEVIKKGEEKAQLRYQHLEYGKEIFLHIPSGEMEIRFQPD